MTNAGERAAIYEDLRERIADAVASPQDDARDVVWTTGDQQLGFARSPKGAIELFIVGDPIETGRPKIARHLEHRDWAANGVAIGANRLLLPNEPHFDRVAAFICAELQLNGVDEHPATAFRRSEELIELALSRGSVESEALVGLCGEMLFLQALMRAKRTLAASILLHDWAGYRPSSRDFQVGPVGVEVKTTTRGASEHHIQGPYQTELGVPVDGVPETGLFLLSVGLLWLPPDHPGAFTLPSIVSELIDHLSQHDRSEFLRRVRGYAGSADDGYEHGAQNLAPEYRRPFETTFVRMYDLTDDRIRLPRSADLNEMDLVPDSVSYRIRLPVQVRGTLNPVVGLAASATRVFLDAGM